MTEAAAKMTCGVIMPISAIDGCDESHWSEVYRILSDAIEDAGFEANIVSNADDVGIIQKRIIQNLYENPVVVCDVSGKNPNVMFELGVRLAFDKPTIIVKDNFTSYSFDTGQIEHLDYPRDLRFSKILEFKEKLSDKIRSTHERASKDPNYTTFLKHFGEFTVAKLDKKEVTAQQYIIEEIKSLKRSIQMLDKPRPRWDRDLEYLERKDGIDICARDRSPTRIARACEHVRDLPGVTSVTIDERGPDHQHIRVRFSPDSPTDPAEVRSMIRRQVGPRRDKDRPVSIPSSSDT